MLRHPDAVSPIEDFSRPHFQNVLPETEIASAQRLLVCTGKIGHELRVERQKRGDSTTGIVFLEQLYPWPEAELSAALAAHPEAHEIVWVQEEPANMGAHSFVMPRLRRLAQGRSVLSVKRSAAASPATGSAKAHEMEQKTLIELALGKGGAGPPGVEAGFLPGRLWTVGAAAPSWASMFSRCGASTVRVSPCEMRCGQLPSTIASALICQASARSCET